MTPLLPLFYFDKLKQIHLKDIQINWKILFVFIKTIYSSQA